MRKILSIFGTRPEAIKMAPVLHCLQEHNQDFESLLCVTAQHRQMLDQVLEVFELRPAYDLGIMKADQDLFDITANVLRGLKPVLEEERPDMILVHGDTGTTMAASLAAFYLGIKVGHVEAGLRTHHKRLPFPEEINRKITGVLADLHFAPTAVARDNLLREGIAADSIMVTGNTVIDALLTITSKIDRDPALQHMLASRFSFLTPGRRLILVTGHRRENFGEGFRNICRALATLAKEYPEVDIVYPVHLNPNVQNPVRQILGRQAHTNIHLIEPLDYLPFVYLMHRSWFVLTDSGGIQEEAPSLGKPVLVMRETTERPEAVSAGTVKLVGSSFETILATAKRLLTDPTDYQSMSTAHNPYGDGQAARRIVTALRDHLKTRP